MLHLRLDLVEVANQRVHSLLLLDFTCITVDLLGSVLGLVGVVQLILQLLELGESLSNRVTRSRVSCLIYHGESPHSCLVLFSIIRRHCPSLFILKSLRLSGPQPINLWYHRALLVSHPGNQCVSYVLIGHSPRALFDARLLGRKLITLLWLKL